MELKPCPFCGSKAMIKELPYSNKIVYREEDIPKDAINIEKCEYRSRTVWKYRTIAYSPQCTNRNCLARTPKKFSSEYYAIKAWNERSQ